MRKFLIFAMLAMLVVGPVFASKPSTPIIGEMYGNDLHGTSVSPIQWGVMGSTNLSGQTQFACKYLAGRGDDAYNLGWKVYILTGGTNTTAGTVVDVTDYVSDTGTFTTASAGANYDSGDPFLLVFGQLGRDLESGNTGGMTFQAAVSSITGISGAADSFYVENFIGYGNDKFNVKYSIEVTKDAAGKAPGRETRDIVDYVSATGLIVCEAFSAALAVGDVVTIIHRSVGSPVTITNYDQPLPGSKADTLMVFRGSWLINEVVGHVTTVIGSGTNNAKLSIVNAGATTDICANLDIDGDADNSFYLITGTFVDAMVNSAAKVPLAGAQAGGIRLAPGDNYLIITTSATKTGEISWSVNATPLSEFSTANAFTVE